MSKTKQHENMREVSLALERLLTNNLHVMVDVINGAVGIIFPDASPVAICELVRGRYRARNRASLVNL